MRRFPHLWQGLLHNMVHIPHTAVAIVVIAAALTVILWLAVRRRPSAEELEHRRRSELAATGRITDGLLIDVVPDLRTPQRLVYRYRVAGVSYECAQDVSGFAQALALRTLDLPVQVRYNRLNPGDSIILSEEWNGLWSLGPDAGESSAPERAGALPQTEDR